LEVALNKKLRGCAQDVGRREKVDFRITGGPFAHLPKAAGEERVVNLPSGVAVYPADGLVLPLARGIFRITVKNRNLKQVWF